MCIWVSNHNRRILSCVKYPNSRCKLLIFGKEHMKCMNWCQLDDWLEQKAYLELWIWKLRITTQLYVKNCKSLVCVNQKSCLIVLCHWITVKICTNLDRVSINDNHSMGRQFQYRQHLKLKLRKNRKIIDLIRKNLPKLSNTAD